ncbi:uncharacterized protein LOC143275744 [Babylonia areolata]|uniref:uncharacterized protein LOC143275744 n=1 Tax=Babylonia areolata TaxID=304850 RepID=UPI003FCF9DF8
MSETSTQERNGDSDARLVRSGHQFSTSTPKTKPLSHGGLGDTPPSRVPRGRRASLGRLLTKPRALNRDFVSPERSSSIGKALADFFSSPETSLQQRRHAPQRGRNISAGSSGLSNSGGDEGKSDTDDVCNTGNVQISVSGGVKHADSLELEKMNGTESLLSTQGEGKTGEVQGNIQQTEPDFQSVGNASDISVNQVNGAVSPAAASNLTCQHTPKKPARTDSVGNMRTPGNLSPIVTATPPSILRTPWKRSQSCQSGKRVRFLQDCLDALTETPKRKRQKQESAVAKDADNENKTRDDRDGAVERNTENNPSTDLSVLKNRAETASSPVSQIPEASSFLTAVCDEGTEDHTQKSGSVQSECSSLADQRLNATKVPEPSQLGSLKPPTSSAETDSSGSHGTEHQGEGRGIGSDVKSQVLANVTVQNGERSSGDAVVGSSATPQSSAQKPQLRLGLRKTPRFLYPTSSQILNTCPKKVFDFSPGTVGVAQASGRVESHPSEDKPADRQSFMISGTEKTVTRCATPVTLCQPDSARAASDTKPPSLAVVGDVNNIRSTGMDSISTARKLSQPPQQESRPNCAADFSVTSESSPTLGTLSVQKSCGQDQKDSFSPTLADPTAADLSDPRRPQLVPQLGGDGGQGKMDTVLGKDGHSGGPA